MAAEKTRTYEGWFATAARLVIADEPREPWTVSSGERTVLVLYSSERQRDAFDKGVFNDELVLEVAASAVQPGATFDLAACNARYQRGSTKLEYVSRSVTGSLQLERAEPDALRGRVTLQSTAPVLDVRGLGAADSSGEFQIDRHTP